MSETQQATKSVPPRDDDAIVLTQVLVPRLESVKTDPTRSDPSSQNSTPKTLTPHATSEVFFKTRLCNNFTNKGSCCYGDGCTFAHGREELRSLWEGRTRVCKMYLRSGSCTYGVNCSYLHVEKPGDVPCASVAEAKGPICYKTNPCFSWKTSGRCSYGAFCRFIHGEEDSRTIGADKDNEVEGGHKNELQEGSSRSRCTYSFKPTVASSRLKKGSEKMRAMKKVEGIYGDWLKPSS